MTLASDEAGLRLKRSGIVAIVRGDYAVSELLEIGGALLTGSVGVMEVTLTTPGALDSISALRRQFGTELLIGAGTVRTAEHFVSATAAGALFTVGPNFDNAVVARARELDVLHLPGVFTPTEAQTAFVAGCRIVKLFPCDVVGPTHLKALRAPLDDIEFVPTGAIGLDNIADYAREGAMAVGVGGALIPRSGWKASEITSKAKALGKAWRGAVPRPRGSIRNHQESNEKP